MPPLPPGPPPVEARKSSATKRGAAKHNNVKPGSSGTLRRNKKGGEGSISSKDSEDGSKFEDCEEEAEPKEVETPSKRGGILGWFGF
jgi:hypothetical protein